MSSPPLRRRQTWAAALLIAGLLSAPGSAQSAPTEDESAEQVVDLVQIPKPDLSTIDPMVEEALNIRTAELKAAIATEDSAVIMEAYGELGYLFHAHELWRQALVAYYNAGQIAPQDARWPYASALVHGQSGDLGKAATAYEISLDIAADNPAALVSLAKIRLEQNQPEWAKALLRHALKVLPESPAVLAVLGQVALSQERWAKAANYYERAIKQQPEATRLNYPLGLAYRGLGDLAKARELIAKRGEVGVRPPDHVRDAIEERKTGERVMLLEGRRAFAAGRFKEARVLFEKASLADPNSIRAKVNWASAIAMDGAPDKAIEIYEGILESDPENGAVLFNLGLLRRQQGNSTAALPHLEKAATAAPDDGQILLELARTLVAEGRLEEASSYANKAVDSGSSDYQARLLAAELNTVFGRWSEAREQLESAQRSLPENGLLAHALARLLAASQDASQRKGDVAVNLASRVAAAAATAEHLETLALALAETSRCAKAAEVQRKAITASRQASQRSRLEQDLKRYEAGAPCRPPFDPGISG